MLAVGDQAPDFTLADEHGQPVTLSSFRGRSPVVLVFYPGDSTPLCTAQLCEFRDAYPELTRAGAEVFGVNPWGEGSHRRFTERHGFPFRLLVDQGNAVARQYQAVLGWGFLSMVYRCVYVVGTDGRIEFAQPGKPPPARVLAALREETQSVLVHLRLTGGDFGSKQEVTAIHALSDRLLAVIERRGLGEFDGDEFGGGECILFMYGPDADAIFRAILPELRASPLTRGGFVLRRYGDPSDPDDPEVRDEL